MDFDKVELVKKASHKLLFALVILVLLMFGILGVASLPFVDRVFVFPTVMIAGMIGAFVSLQRRLKSLPVEDLRLLTESSLYPWLSPLAGGLLASVLYLLFLSGLLGGALFPVFEIQNGTEATTHGLQNLLEMFAPKSADYGKLLFWSFVAGFSEKFVVDIIGRFEKQAADEVVQGTTKTDNVEEEKP